MNLGGEYIDTTGSYGPAFACFTSSVSGNIACQANQKTRRAGTRGRGEALAASGTSALSVRRGPTTGRPSIVDQRLMVSWSNMSLLER
jgi:hypothetical protein